MNPSPNEPLAIDLEGPQRKVTVNDHALFIESLLTPEDHDEIDAFVAELRQLKPEGFES